MAFSDSRPGGKKKLPIAGQGLKPEVLAAISASLNAVMDSGASAEMVAAVTAAIIHAVGGGKAIRFKKTGNAWAAFGRQKIMDSRQMF
ncbi:MAG: hypothetical protein H6Q74_429 [Firmicutes bacterium]|nr:hypothetical protein [Bacillota bacterium]